MNAHPPFNPIIVGGMGGSGTRVVAKILEANGVFMGRFLNAEYDNLLFPIFGYPARFHWSSEKLKPYISLFESVHLDKRLTLQQWLLLLRPLFNNYKRGKHIKRVRHALRLHRMHSDNPVWGWKVPTNQYFIKQLNEHYPHCFYIHVIRHGLDMAFSQNRRQLEMYGAYFGISGNLSETTAPVGQLDLWIKTNAMIREYCTTSMPSRHYILRFDDLCIAPEQIITEMLAKIGLESNTPVSELAKLIEVPASRDRYLSHDLFLFSADQIAAVQEFGFSVG